ncbi:chloride channel protein [Dictyostelium discoideum AX4]|uniref:Chloride channel protein C n=1 Tax=Dictyostelium discoideum TaxID=44689 RepID=CLCC_DICDI|nr:chloride channel protein [Dictyostelium discoideum AX4]Q75JF3.1 RecName: Full=Chloride channel protein C [Dictyostelium discoideum]EAL69414.1 chloride channel protein [Dictyostelium discoideum AX4]|eukprot:XP_643243.1 chloride channel protein [Dictyostelium discoideum AX4]
MGSSLNKPLSDRVEDINNQSSMIYDPWRHRGDVNSTYHSSSSVTHRRRNHRLSPLEKQKMKNIQSLNFSVNDNLLQREEYEKTTKGLHLKKTFGKWIICLFLGVIVGCIAYVIKMVVQLLQGLKFHYTNHYVSNGLQGEAFLTFLGINLLFVFLSCLMVIVAGPLASSSGIPEVKGILNGVKVREALGFRALLGKIVSLVLSFSSGLFVGPEGPMIHIGSAVGAAISQFKSSTMGFYPSLFLSYRNDRDKRDFISIGAATGLAAAFGAPIGGVLFSIEEVSSFWSRQLTWRTFFTCVIAAFTTNFLLQGIGSSPDMHDTGLLTFGFSRLYLFRYSELLCFCFLGLIGGLLGAFFVFLNIHLNKWRKEKLKQNPYLRLFEALFVSVVTSVVCYYASFIFDCRYQSNIVIETSVCEDQSNTEMVQFFCPDGMYSELGSLLFGNPDQALRRLYSRTNNMFTLPPLLVFTLISLFFSIWSSGLWVAGGLFVPMMMVGAGFGRLFGQTISMWFTNIDSSIYALVGSAAMMAGYCRMTVCIVVIMVELTEGTQYLVPIILAVMISKWVGDFFNESVYEHLMEQKSIPFLQSKPPHSTNNIRISDVMSKNVVVLPEVCQVRLLVNILNSNNHNAFPVINSGPYDNQRLYRGIILRDHILVLLFYRVFYRGTGEEIYLDENFDFDKFTTETSKSPPPLSEMNFDQFELDSFIDLRPYMNSSGVTIHNTFSFVEAYKLFRNMGLRHLPVIDINNEVVGMVTRNDLF